MDATEESRRRWTLARVLKLLAVNVVALLLLVLAAEIAVRAKVEGSLGAGLSSLGGADVRPSSEGESDWLEPHPVLGYRLNTSHDRVSSLGIRHPELTAEEPFEGLRVVVLGDSVSWDQDGWVAELRDDLAAREDGEVEVVNAAIPGYTTHQERLLFESGLDASSPDLVLLQYCLNDNHEFLHELTNGAWLVRRDAKQALLPDASEGGPLAWLSRRSYLVYELRKHLYLRREKQSGFFPWDSSPDFAPAWQASSWSGQRRELEALRDAVRASGARMAVVAVPYELQIARKYLEHDRAYTLAPQGFLREICAELGLPFLDVQPAFEARRGDPLYREGDPVHLSPVGHELLAERVLAFLDAEGLLP